MQCACTVQLVTNKKTYKLRGTSVRHRKSGSFGHSKVFPREEELSASQPRPPAASTASPGESGQAPHVYNDGGARGA